MKFRNPFVIKALLMIDSLSNTSFISIPQPQYITTSKLINFIAASELTTEYGGMLTYNHDVWLANRLVNTNKSVMYRVRGNANV